MESLYYFRYKIQYWCEFYEKEIIVEGIIAAYSVGDAIEKLLYYYGDDETNKLTIEYVEDKEIVFPLEEYTVDGSSLKEKSLS